MNMNSNKGKGLLDLDTPTEKVSITTQNKIEENAAKMAQHAESAADIKSISSRITKKRGSHYYVRSYKISESNLQKLEAIKSTIGIDFNFQVNKALEGYFEQNHPEVAV